MHPTLRNAFPYVALVVLMSALVWAVSFGTLPPADFSFHNGDEIKTVDPSKATGQPEHRVMTSLFEGLYREWPLGYELDEEGNVLNAPEPDENGNYPLDAAPGVAESVDISEDGRVYTFHIREAAKWSDGSKFTADDFVWSWRRTLHPETASQYAYQLWYLKGAKKYTTSTVTLGGLIEVELSDRLRVGQLFPRGTIRRGKLLGIARPPEPQHAPDASDEDKAEAESEWQERSVYLVEENSKVVAFSKGESTSGWSNFKVDWLAGSARDLPSEVVNCLHVLPDFEATVGVKAPDDKTLVVTLQNRTPFFLHLTTFYPLFPMNRKCIETHGTPAWTKPENIVSNGTYNLEFRRFRDRLRLVKNPLHWSHKQVKLETVDVFGFKSETTALNMYLTGQLDWITDAPSTVIPQLMARKERDYVPTPLLIIYFYRINVTRAPCDDIHVRRALNMAIDKQLICDKVTQAGQQPARSLVPPGLPGYRSPLCEPFDPVAAREELKKSKYANLPGGIPKVEILYNTNENHRAIAEVIQQQWKNNLGIDAELKNSEWTTYLSSIHSQEYSIARAGWVPDYPDANTFIDMWVTGGENNETGWGNPDYDAFVKKAAEEPGLDRRLRWMEQAEEILMAELPIIPIYYYVSKGMVSPRVKGFFPNVQDQHPLYWMRIED
ncbi:MAG: peptide ABC transporter substrate-binding protein [Planctomycetes bacterium]|nr:peptide ABC transporter substrate-binding protein [Planctomycetota bacterium]